MSETSYLGINIDLERDKGMSQAAYALMRDYYMLPGEVSPQQSFARAATAYCYGDYGLAQRIYDYVSLGYAMFSSPVLSNAPEVTWHSEPVMGTGKLGTIKDMERYGYVTIHSHNDKVLPISCFEIFVPDSIKGQISTTEELAILSVAGGGVGVHNGIRAISDKAPGPIPYMKTLDAAIGYYRQGKTRRGTAAYFMDVSHPDIIEHIKFRVPTGGDTARKSDNRKSFHVGVNITDAFVKAVDTDDVWDLVCPHSGKVYEVVRARELWEEILRSRELTGEPFMVFIDVAQEALPENMKAKGLKIKGSNICTEIFLPTDEDRSSVCCLSSINVEHYDIWKSTTIVEDFIVYLDNVLQFFIDNAIGNGYERTVTGALKERSLGLGTFGWHYLLQSKSIPWESGGVGSASQLNHIVYSTIKGRAIRASEALGIHRGVPEDCDGRRNAHLLAIAPNSNSAIISDSTPSIEPINSNYYTTQTRAGSFVIKNKVLNKYLHTYALDNWKSQEWVDEQWEEIRKNGGSVQGLEWMPNHDKDVFKTSWELDQHWVVQHAEDRQQYVCQGQSVNLFFPPMSSREYINSVHLKAARGRKLKSLYYMRTSNKSRADVVDISFQRRALKDWNESEECVACMG